MVYTLSLAASLDLETIWIYTYENWSLTLADVYINLIIDEIERITKEPTLGKSRGDLGLGYFQTKAQSHFIFYKLNKDEHRIEVIRILHQRMDSESHLIDEH